MSFPLPAQFDSRVRRAEPLSRHTSWHVGGPADIFFMPRDRDDLIAFLKALPADVPLLWLGLGSNLLVRDGGIPGTVGGALEMNAGAFQGETWRQVRTVETIDRHGAVRQRTAGEYGVSYRHIEAPAAGEWFLAATFHFEAGSSEEATRALLDRRRQTQPIGEWSCGSVFTNPPGDHAARLIESAGLKGLRIGGAVVSTKHANFIVNEGEASARDIETLIGEVQREVERQHGRRLTPECRIVGEAA
jgi:UDP-N-acetylmuramate dehydrogenase